MSHKTWQLVNGFECLLSSIYCIRFETFCSLFSLKNFLKYILLRNQFYNNMDAIKYLSLLFFLVTNSLIYYGRRYFKLFTNCHVSWVTLCVINYELEKSFSFYAGSNESFSFLLNKMFSFICKSSYYYVILKCN